MGEPRNRFARSSLQRSHLLPAALAAGAVGAVALLFAVAGVDDVEVLATLFFAPVCIAALLGGRNVGYVAAGAASTGYMAMRFDDVEQSGAVRVVVLIAARAACYGVVAWATPLLQRRVPALSAAGLPLSDAPRHRAAAIDSLPDADRVDWPEPTTEPPQPPLLEPPVAVPEQAWAPQPSPEEWVEGEPELQPATVASPSWEPWDARAQYAESVGSGDWEAPVVEAAPRSPPPQPEYSDWGAGDWQQEQPVSPRGRWDTYTPPAPTVPTGWVDDATVPLGDEMIPVGYTGELFLPKDLRAEDVSESLAAGTGSTNGGGHPPSYSYLDEGLDEGYDEPLAEDPQPPPPRQRRSGGGGGAGGVDPETRLWNAHYFRDRLTMARDEARRTGAPFSVVMVQVPDEPFQPLPYRRQVAVLRELGHQFIQARMIDHLVHLPDGAQHWFAVVLPNGDRTVAHTLERRLRSAIAAYLRSRGLHIGEVQSASLTSPDDDDAMAAVWSSLLGSTSVR